VEQGGASRQDARPTNPSDTEKQGLSALMEATLLCRNAVKCFRAERNCRALEAEFLGSIHPPTNLFYNPGDIAGVRVFV